MTYAFDPELLPWLTMLPEGLDFNDVQALRARMTSMTDQMPGYEPENPVTVEEKLIPGPAGAPEIRVRVYTPTTAPAPRPAFVSIHGGGFAIGNLDQDAPGSMEIADKIGAVVVSADYPAAPTPMPARDLGR